MQNYCVVRRFLTIASIGRPRTVVPTNREDGTVERIGVIGVGEIGKAVVDGLYDGGGDTPEVHLSPRGARTAAELAERHAGVRVCPDNQAVVDRSDIVIIAVLFLNFFIAPDRQPEWIAMAKSKPWLDSLGTDLMNRLPDDPEAWLASATQTPSRTTTCRPSRR